MSLPSPPSQEDSVVRPPEVKADSSKPKIIASAFISSAPKKTRKRPAAAPKPPPSGSCRKFWALGRCEFGDGCKYSHTSNPDVPPQTPSPAAACKKFWVDGKCDFGDNCKYPHVSNPAIDPSTVGEGTMTYKKAMKIGGRTLDLDRWMDPKTVESYTVAPPSDGVVFHGTLAQESRPADGVDLPSDDAAAELAALERLLSPQVLARIRRKRPETDGSAQVAAAAHTCTCHLMPGFNTETGEKIVPCFNCNEAALAEKKKAQLAVAEQWVPELPSVEEGAPGEENNADGLKAMSALLDKIDGVRSANASDALTQTSTWAEWEQWQKENGLEEDDEHDV